MELIYAALLIWGVHCIFSEGYVLHFNRASVPDWLKKPVVDCPPCMSSVYGTVYYFAIIGGLNVGDWIFFCVQLCGLNYLLVQLLDKSRIIIDEE